jgi:hypothetical protein
MKPNAGSFLLLFLFLLLTACAEKKDVILTLEDGWKFKTGDSALYASPGFDDSSWDSINPKKLWEYQGFPNYDGFAWYRKHILITSEMKTSAFFKDSIQIILGEIDDTEETYLNGELLGQNGFLIPAGEKAIMENFTGYPDAYRILRRYVLSVNDPRLKWDQENILAVRVNDHGGGGGLYGQRVEISMVDFKDQISIDASAIPLRLVAENYFVKGVILSNLSTTYTSKGKLTARVEDGETGKLVFDTTLAATIDPKGKIIAQIRFTADQTNRNVITLLYKDTPSGKMIGSRFDIPYILTPKPGDEPRINGAAVTGVRPGRPFLFYIPVTGLRPVKDEATGLPAGLSLDPATGIITGSVKQKGEYKVELKVSNEKGTATKSLRIMVGDKLALTPPMGWNSWNCWGLSVNDAKVRAAVDQFVSTGLIDHGWTYVNIDDGWEAPERASNGKIVTNDKFPDMNGLTDYVHSKGMKMGIYSSPGPLTCGGYLGSYQHELQDAQSWAQWGIDYIKYDWCSYGEKAKDNSLAELQKPYILMKQCLDKQDRDIVFSLCQYGMGDVSKWGGQVGGNLWRTTGDITDTWESMSGIGFGQADLAPYAKPGEWNDPDMLVVGWVGWGPSLHPSRLTASEQYTHISLWAMLSAPLLIGCDLTKLDDFTLNLLTNDEVIAINQDPLGKQASLIKSEKSIQLWVKELEDGSKAIGIFNLSEEDQKTTLLFSDLKASGKLKLHDAWRQKDLGEFEGQYPCTIPAHGVLLLRTIQ